MQGHWDEHIDGNENNLKGYWKFDELSGMSLSLGLSYQINRIWNLIMWLKHILFLKLHIATYKTAQLHNIKGHNER